MSNELKPLVSGWTIDTLKEYFEVLIVGSEKKYEERFNAQQQAILKSEVAAEKRFDSVNEFRNQLKDQTNTFIPRPEADQRFKALSEKIDFLSGVSREQGGFKRGFSEGWGIFIGAAGLLIAFLTIINK